MSAIAVAPAVQELTYRDARKALYRVAEAQWRQVDKYAIEGIAYSPLFEIHEPSSVIGYLIAELVGDDHLVAVSEAIYRNGRSTSNAQALHLAGYSIDTETAALLARIEENADACLPYGEAIRRGMRRAEA